MLAASGARCAHSAIHTGVYVNGTQGTFDSWATMPGNRAIAIQLITNKFEESKRHVHCRLHMELGSNNKLVMGTFPCVTHADSGHRTLRPMLLRTIYPLGTGQLSGGLASNKPTSIRRQHVCVFVCGFSGRLPQPGQIFYDIWYIEQSNLGEMADEIAVGMASKFQFIFA